MAALFHSTVAQFIETQTTDVVGVLSQGISNSFSNLLATTIISWERTISVLRRELTNLVAEVPSAIGWGLLLEYDIPRRNKRIDAVLLMRSSIFVLEFKTGDTGREAAAKTQAEDYALELRDFHSASHDRVLVPVAICRCAAELQLPETYVSEDVVWPPIAVGEAALCELILLYLRDNPSWLDESQLSAADWDDSAYKPVFNIIEAARKLFSDQSNRDLSHSHADEQQRSDTTDLIMESIARAQRDHQKIICFVTGVPGAGKTLVGLNVVHHQDVSAGDRPAATFLTGNGPLVKIVTQALVRDYRDRTIETRAELLRRIQSRIQNVHGFLKEHRRRDKLPPERVVIFDEAQRAWDANKVFKKAKQRATAAEIETLVEKLSEPGQMLEIMDRLPDWAVIIALVGGGQEIHDGEAGLAEWGRTIREYFPHWRVLASPESVSGGPATAGSSLFSEGLPTGISVETHRLMHLPVSERSFRAKAVAEWVNAVVAGQADVAAKIAARVTSFPIVLTRSLEAARTWLSTQTRGLRRCGLLASSGALRLRADAIEVSSDFRNGFPFEEWFLAPLDDIRSSNWLEVAATEFECQGLEIDFAGVCWGGDFVRTADGWLFRQLKGAKWQQVKNPKNRQFMTNKYRVLMTRAREGMVLWIPHGDPTDITRDPALFDTTAEYLERCGVHML